MHFNNIKGFVFKPHPDVNKQQWNKGKMICASDQGSGFATHQKLAAIQYRYSSKEESDVPFTLNAFNSKKGTSSVITLELEHNADCNLQFKKFERVTVAVRIGDSQLEIQKKSGTLEHSGEVMLWHVDSIADEGSAVLSFSSPDFDYDSMFPVELKFEEAYSLLDLHVEKVTNIANGESLSLKVLQSLQSDNYKFTSDN